MPRLPPQLLSCGLNIQPKRWSTHTPAGPIQTATAMPSRISSSLPTRSHTAARACEPVVFLTKLVDPNTTRPFPVAPCPATAPSGAVPAQVATSSSHRSACVQFLATAFPPPHSQNPLCLPFLNACLPSPALFLANPSALTARGFFNPCLSRNQAAFRFEAAHHIVLCACFSRSIPSKTCTSLRAHDSQVQKEGACQGPTAHGAC